MVRFYDSNQDGDYIDAADNTLYYVTDAANNVTGVIDQSTGTVSERYVFDPYGKPIFYNGSWGSISGTAKSTNLFFGGYLYDGESGLYYIRERYYHPTLGKWMQRDFAGYIDGGSLYEYVQSNPGNGVDPSGEYLQVLIGAGIGAIWGGVGAIIAGSDAKDVLAGALGGAAGGAAVSLGLPPAAGGAIAG